MVNAGILQGAIIAITVTHAAASQQGPSGPSPRDKENDRVSSYLLWTWACVTAALVVHQLVTVLVRYIRTIACLNNGTQRYFAAPNVFYANFRRYLWDAPLYRLRHLREFALSAAVNIGTLPSRVQTLFLVGYLAMNVTLMVVGIEWNEPARAMYVDLIKRSGRLSVLNMIPLFLLAGRNNPLIKWCGITFDTFNLVHRWIGRVVVLEAVVHTVAWVVLKVQVAGWHVVGKALRSHGSMPQAGLIGTVAFVAILVSSPSIVRHAFYETFLHAHIAFAAVAVAAVWVHVKHSPILNVIQGVVAIWVLERFTRLATIVYRNIGRGGTKAEIEVLPGDAIRVTLKLARPWTFRPGQHAYVYLPAVGWWTSHPFSLAWSDEEEDLSSERGLVLSRQDVLDMRKTTMSLLIRRRTGLTEALYRKADGAPGGKFATRAIVEGPYGAQTRGSYGTVLLFAAGVGVSHQLPHVRALVAGFADGSVAARRVALVWIIRSPEHLEWVRPWMARVLALPRRREVLRILLFVTRPRSTKEIHSPSASVQMFPGKPNVQALVDAEVESRVGAMCVSVCGTGSLADDVRRAGRRWMGRANVDFVEESFSW